MSINGNRPGEGAANSVGINNATEPNRLAPTTQAIKGSNGLAGVALLDAALRYASAGFAVFPCQPRMKEPAVARGFLAATTNPQTIRRLWRVTNRNIGLRTGAASSVWVLDIDGPAGEASLAALEATHGALPVTCTVITQKGRHLWFVTEDCPIPCSASRIGAGIDVRAEGGYVLVPPSVHPRGHIYRFERTNDIQFERTIEIAPAPPWLVRLAQKKPKTKTISERAIAARHDHGQRRQGTCGAYGAAALNREAVTLANVLTGGRNHALNRAAFNLFQLVAGGELERDQVLDRLLGACHANGLVQDDGLPSVMATIRSGGRAGLQHPRSRGAA